ncbi:hypothetical protein ACTA71_003872 [Dictyostelium dimigraforme]
MVECASSNINLMFSVPTTSNLLVPVPASMRYHNPSTSTTSSLLLNVDLLSKMTVNRLDWDLEIKSIEFAINNSVNSSTGQTPFAVTLGFEPRTPLNINANYNLPHIEATEYYRQAARDNLEHSNCNVHPIQ